MKKICEDLQIPISTLTGWLKEFESHGEERFPGSCKLRLCNDKVYLLKKSSLTSPWKEIS
jgi:hypothetical protein